MTHTSFRVAASSFGGRPLRLTSFMMSCCPPAAGLTRNTLPKLPDPTFFTFTYFIRGAKARLRWRLVQLWRSKSKACSLAGNVPFVLAVYLTCRRPPSDDAETARTPIRTFGRNEMCANVRNPNCRCGTRRIWVHVACSSNFETAWFFCFN